MTAKEFLRRVRGFDRRIAESEERAKRLRARLEAGRQSQLTGMPRGGGADWTETADRLIELERRINAQTREMARLKALALDAIAAVEHPQEREALELYYVDGYSWEDVAALMGLDLRWVYRLHGRGLLKIRVPDEIDH